MITIFNKFNEAYIDKEGELRDFTPNIIFYEGNVAFVYKKHEKLSSTEYRIYGDFTTEADARDMETGHKYYQMFPGYILFNPKNGQAQPHLKSSKKNVWDQYEDDDYYDLDNLCYNVVAEIFG